MEKVTLEKRKTLKYCNVLSDVFLLFLAFLLAGWLRKWSLWGDTFFLADIQTFQPLGLLYAVTMTACYALQGSYQSLHIRNIQREILKISLINILGLLLTAAVLFVFQLSQFSRLWLLYFYVISTFVIVLKRVIVDNAVTAYEVKHHYIPNAILIGSGKLAVRFYYTVMSNDSTSMHYVGNIADIPNEAIPRYCGTIQELPKIISTYYVDVIVIAEDNQRVDNLERILAIATNHKIRVCMVPVYTDLISSKESIQNVSGLHMIDLQLLDTCEVMGLSVAATNFPKTIDMIKERLDNWRGRYICIAGVEDAVIGYENDKMSEIQNRAVMTLPVGSTLLAHNRKEGFASAEEVSGADLMEAILSQSKENGWRHYFLGDDFQVLCKLQNFVQEKYEGVTVVGSYALPKDQLSVMDDQIVTEAIANRGADFVWVDLPSPQQECWMAAHENRIPALMIGVGRTFETLLGIDNSPKGLAALIQYGKKELSSRIKYLWWDWR